MKCFMYDEWLKKKSKSVQIPAAIEGDKNYFIPQANTATDMFLVLDINIEIKKLD